LRRSRRFSLLTVEQLEDRLAPANVQLTSDPGVQQMPSVAVDPLDPQHVVVAFLDYSLLHTGYAGIGVKVSRDGGDTWQAETAVPLPGGFDQGAAVPVARFDADGHVFISFMSVTFLGGCRRSRTRAAVRRGR
jgi:hypothetical protein